MKIITKAQTALLNNVERLKGYHYVRTGMRPNKKHLLALDDIIALIKAQEK